MLVLADTTVDLSTKAAAESIPPVIEEPLEAESRDALSMNDDLNQLAGPGVYMISENNIPANAPYYLGGVLMECRLGEARAQFFFAEKSGSTARRFYRNGAWDRWSYPGTDAGAFAGKTVSILGDSVSTYQGTIPTEEGFRAYYNGKRGGVSSLDQMWWKRLIDQTGMTLCVTNSGSTSCCSSRVLNGTVPASSDQRIRGLAAEDGTTPDVIIIFMGTNDYSHGIAKGTWNRDRIPEKLSESKFSDSYALILEKISEAYPKARVYCCTLPYTSRFSTSRRSVDANKASVTRSEWNDIIRRVASYYGCEVIEFEHCGIDGDNLPFYSGDDAVDEDGVEGEGENGRGLHPNARGQELLYLEALKHFMYQNG